jgi:putative transposase
VWRWRSLARASWVTEAYASHPERFVRVMPQPPMLPTAVWINPPEQEVTKTH